MNAKENMKKIMKIVGIGGFIIGVLSGVYTIFGDNGIIMLGCKIIFTIGLISFLIPIIYYGIGALQALSEKREEKSILQTLDNTIKQLNQQYERLQKDLENMEETIGDKIVCPAYIKTFEYNSTDVTRVTNELLERHPESEIHIICFGRNGYGDVIEHIKEKGLKVKAKIIVYNPEAGYQICRSKDKEDICKHIRNMLSNDVSVEVYASNIPPSIRACVIYEQGRPIWGAMQSYRFEKRNAGGLSLQKPSRSLIAVCGDTSSQRDFSGMIKCFEEEFDYLLNDYCTAELKDDEVSFKKVGEGD